MFTIHNGIVVTLNADTEFVSISTFEAAYGRSHRFYVNASRLYSWLESDNSTSFMDQDLMSFVRMFRETGDSIRMRFSWVRNSSADRSFTGYQQSFSVPVSILQDLLMVCGTRKLLVPSDEEKSHARITLSLAAHKLIGHLDREHSRAFSKMISRSFMWGSDREIFLYSDCGADFGFAETNGISGGLIASYDYVRGSDGRKHSRIRYEMHT